MGQKKTRSRAEQHHPRALLTNMQNCPPEPQTKTDQYRVLAGGKLSIAVNSPHLLGGQQLLHQLHLIWVTLHPCV